MLFRSAPCAFERDENGVFQQIKDWKPDEDEEDPDMDILKQCQKWHEKGQYQKIIDALEAIPAGERTPEMDSELARAYNNLAEMCIRDSSWDGRQETNLVGPYSVRDLYLEHFGK